MENLQVLQKNQTPLCHRCGIVLWGNNCRWFKVGRIEGTQQSTTFRTAILPGISESLSVPSFRIQHIDMLSSWTAENQSMTRKQSWLGTSGIKIQTQYAILSSPFNSLKSNETEFCRFSSIWVSMTAGSPIESYPMSSACSAFRDMLSLKMEGRKISWHFAIHPRSSTEPLHWHNDKILFPRLPSLSWIGSRYVLPTEALFPILYEIPGWCNCFYSCQWTLPLAKTLCQACHGMRWPFHDNLPPGPLVNLPWRPREDQGWQVCM